MVIGAVGMDLKREDFYRKELDFLISTSYGPGRYDEEYEEKGIDYPIGYVRWTENRNMEEFLQMLAEQKLNLEPLIDYEFSVEEADFSKMAGIFIDGANFCNLLDNNVSNNYIGIQLYYSDNNTLFKNNVSDNHAGIYLNTYMGSSNNNNKFYWNN